MPYMPLYIKPRNRANRGVRATAIQEIRRELRQNQDLVAELHLRLDYVEAVISIYTHEDIPHAHSPSHPTD